MGEGTSSEGPAGNTHGAAGCRQSWGGKGSRQESSPTGAAGGPDDEWWDWGSGAEDPAPLTRLCSKGQNAHKTASRACHVTYKKCWPLPSLAWEPGKHKERKREDVVLDTPVLSATGCGRWCRSGERGSGGPSRVMGGRAFHRRERGAVYFVLLHRLHRTGLVSRDTDCSFLVALNSPCSPSSPHTARAS